MQALYAVLIALGLFGLNAWLYTANKKTPVPEGCENLRPDCAACGIKNCAMRAQMQEGEDK